MNRPPIPLRPGPVSPAAEPRQRVAATRRNRERPAAPKAWRAGSARICPGCAANKASPEGLSTEGSTNRNYTVSLQILQGTAGGAKGSRASASQPQNHQDGTAREHRSGRPCIIRRRTQRQRSQHSDDNQQATRPAQPCVPAQQLLPSAVLFDCQADTRRAEQAAADLEVPAIAIPAGR